MMALRDTFDQRVDGVRVVDTFCYPTVTQKVRQRITLSSNAAGELAFTFLPSPLYSIQIFSGSAVGYNSFAANTSAGYMLSPASMQTSGFGSFRVVACGFRLLLADTVAGAKGIYSVAPVPVATNCMVDWPTLNSVAVSAGIYPTDFMGIPQANTAVELLPHARTFNANDLQYQGDFMAVSVPYDSAIKDFRPTCTRGNTCYTAGTLYPNTFTGDIMSATAAGAVTYSGNSQLLNMVGNTAIVLYASGLPPSTAELSMEIVYHMEYVNNPTAGVIGMAVGACSPAGSTAILERAYTSVMDTFYLGRKALSLAFNLGMLGVQYHRRRRNRAIEVD